MEKELVIVDDVPHAALGADLGNFRLSARRLRHGNG